MPDSVKFDVTELADLAEDLRGAGQRFSDQVPRILKRGANNIKKDAKARLGSQISGVYLPHYPRAITYDITTAHQGSRVTAEIGPETDKLQGGMGPGVEFGSANHAPIPHLTPAFEAEVPKTQAQLQAAAIGAVLKR